MKEGGEKGIKGIQDAVKGATGSRQSTEEEKDKVNLKDEKVLHRHGRHAYVISTSNPQVLPTFGHRLLKCHAKRRHVRQ